MEKKEKGLNLKVYAVVVFFAVAAALVLIVTFTFKSKYPAFHPEEVARNYVDTIVQTGDGYNAYKNALVSKSQKYGNFIRSNYMNPVIYRDAGYTPDSDVKSLTGYNDKSFIGEKTAADDGTLQGQVIDTMYAFYAELVSDGWDNYDEIFTRYFEQLTAVREEVFGDKYLTDDIMFTALESNVRKYGEYLTGTKDSFDENTGNQTGVKTIGAYQEAYGEDYKFTSFATKEEELDLSQYMEKLNAEELGKYGVSPSEITQVKSYLVEVKTADGSAVTEASVTVAKIGNSWYVDSSSTDTSALYAFWKQS